MRDAQAHTQEQIEKYEGMFDDLDYSNPYKDVVNPYENMVNPYEQATNPYDDMGNVLINQTVTESDHLEVNLESVKKGIYLIKAFNAKGEGIDKRFVVE